MSGVRETSVEPDSERFSEELPDDPTRRLKITGFENYGLALGKIASRIFRAG